MQTTILTSRQQEVLDLLRAGHSARDAAGKLGISRNAVYQTLNRLREKGVLATDFTPSGQPPRRLTRAVREASERPRQSDGSLLARFRELEGTKEDERYVELLAEAIATGDIAALSYELARNEIEGPFNEVTARLIETSLRRNNVL